MHKALWKNKRSLASLFHFWQCEASEAWDWGQGKQDEQEKEPNSLQQLNVKLGNQLRYLHGAEVIFNSKSTITSDKLLSHVYNS